ncbi:hypothetical protein HELRODRAFT_172618 [Helobdella robusta]|uniref:Endonuclease/exonuclease/phosphatase domain-containing protein n=1 Tax=Helobdella robusta TaxID=6412 RepID=T1F5N0_HELRO|nr:hypothetical protein HELRODRAFT_172618 [Helobdella robusta]ESO04261.1 hypothetical protein HELRODRAFT_172618 [Helobdella robusta]
MALLIPFLLLCLAMLNSSNSNSFTKDMKSMVNKIATGKYGQDLSLTHIDDDALFYNGYGNTSLYVDGKLVKTPLMNMQEFFEEVVMDEFPQVIAVEVISTTHIDPMLSVWSTSGSFDTNERWKCSNEPTNGWNQIEFDSSEMPQAIVKFRNTMDDERFINAFIMKLPCGGPETALWIGDEDEESGAIYCRLDDFELAMDQYTLNYEFETTVIMSLEFTQVTIDGQMLRILNSDKHNLDNNFFCANYANASNTGTVLAVVSTRMPMFENQGMALAVWSSDGRYSTFKGLCISITFLPDHSLLYRLEMLGRVPGGSSIIIISMILTLRYIFGIPNGTVWIGIGPTESSTLYCRMVVKTQWFGTLWIILAVVLFFLVLIGVIISWCPKVKFNYTREQNNSTTGTAIQQSSVPVPSPACRSLLYCFKNATNTMVNTTANNHTGSVVTRDNKDRIAALGTKSYKEKFVTESERGEMKIKFTVGFWNVRSLRQAGTYAMLKKSLRGLDMMWLVCLKLDVEVENWRKENCYGQAQKPSIFMELMYARFKGYPRDIIVIVAYAPTTNHLYDEVETFYKQLKQTMTTLPKKDVKIIVVDWNAKIGSDNIEFEEVMISTTTSTSIPSTSIATAIYNNLQQSTTTSTSTSTPPAHLSCTNSSSAIPVVVSSTRKRCNHPNRRLSPNHPNLINIKFTPTYNPAKIILCHLPPTIYILNVFSIVKPHAIEHLRCDVYHLHPDIIIITESWLKPDHPDGLIGIDGYTPFRKDRPGRRRGGGVVIYLKSSISSQIHIVPPNAVNDTLETLCLKCIIDSEPYIICAIYHPPNHPSYEVSTMMCYIDELSNTALGSDSKLIIGGDFNQLDHHSILQTGLHPIFWCPTHQGLNLDRIYGINGNLDITFTYRSHVSTHYLEKNHLISPTSSFTEYCLLSISQQHQLQ